MNENRTIEENNWRQIFAWIWRAAQWFREKLQGITSHPRVITFASLLIFIWSLNIIARELKNYSPAELAQAFDNVRISTTMLAIAAATASYIALSFNDRFCMSMIGKRLLLGRTIRASLATNALAKTLGFSWAIAATARSKLYRKWGLTTGEIGALSMTTGTMVLLGAISVAALGLLLGAPEIARHGKFAASIWWLMAAISSIPALAWYLFALKGPVDFKWGQAAVFRPTGARALAHLAVAMFDKIGAGLALYILLPDHGGWSLPAFLAVFTLAGLLGALSGAPGGLGVFEATILAMAPNSQNIPGAAVALVFYRLIYNVVPLFGATIILGLDHAHFIAKPADKAVRHISNRAEDFAPQIIALLVFAYGFALIAAATLPNVFHNYYWASGKYAWPIFDVLHGASAAIGMALMVSACGLWREGKSAFYSVLATLVFAFLVTSAGGVIWPALALNLVILALLLFNHDEFNLASAVVKRALGFGWIATMFGSLVAIIWYAYFTYQSVPYSHAIWSETGVNADAARALRALVAATSTFAISSFAIWLFAPQKPVRIDN